MEKCAVVAGSVQQALRDGPQTIRTGLLDPTISRDGWSGMATNHHTKKPIISPSLPLLLWHSYSYSTVCTTIQYTNAKYKRGTEICCLQTILSTKVWLKYFKLFPYWFWSSLFYKTVECLKKYNFIFRSLLVSGVGFTLSTSEISTLLPYDTAAHQDHCGRYWIRNPGPLPRILVRYHWATTSTNFEHQKKVWLSF